MQHIFAITRNSSAPARTKRHFAGKYNNISRGTSSRRIVDFFKIDLSIVEDKFNHCGSIIIFRKTAMAFALARTAIIFNSEFFQNLDNRWRYETHVNIIITKQKCRWMIFFESFQFHLFILVLKCYAAILSAKSTGAME